MLDHVIIQADDLAALGAFYDQVAAVLDGRRTMNAPALIGYGGHDGSTRLYFSAATDAGGRQAHIALTAATREQVDQTRALAGRLGAVILHETREWPEYHPGYYAAFIRDPAGNNLEIVCHSPAAAPAQDQLPSLLPA
jgi:catechol 2,3-dioxygenase-like lactoylglutathione lyase family enzyme